MSRLKFVAIFVEVQFQPDTKFYSRFSSEIFLYLHQYPQTNPCKAVVIYPERKTETDDIYRYADLINIASINRIYLHENLTQAATDWRLSLLELIIADVKKAPLLAKRLITTLAVQNQPQESLLDLIETIVTYKFPHLTRDEVRKMLHLPDIHLDIRTTQFYKDVFFEGRQEGEKKGKIEGEKKGKIEGEKKGKIEGERKVILNLLTRRFGKLNNPLVAQIKALDLKQLDCLTESLFDFKKLDELVAWLNQYKR